MRVNVFISEIEKQNSPAVMLLLPLELDAGAPDHLQHQPWRHLGTADTEEALADLAEDAVVAVMVSDGYVLASAPDR